MEFKKDRIIVLVDHANVFHNLQELKIRVDYDKLINLLVPWTRGWLIGKIIYMGVHNKTVPKKQKFIDYLQSRGWMVVRLPIIISPKGKKQQKRIDLRIYRHGVGFIQENMCDTVILVSGDGDLAELVISIRELDKNVEIWSFRKSIAHSLIEEAGEENVHYLDDNLDQITKQGNQNNRKKIKRKGSSANY